MSEASREEGSVNGVRNGVVVGSEDILNKYMSAAHQFRKNTPTELITSRLAPCRSSTQLFLMHHLPCDSLRSSQPHGPRLVYH